MIDTDALKRDTDILDLIGRDTQLVKATTTGEYAGPCPLCHDGTDRLRVWPAEGRFWCRKCDRKGDAIAYAMARDNSTFAEACATLGGPALATTTARPKLTATKPDRPAGPPPDDWQRKARAVMLACVNNLWEPEGMRAREWLVARGLKAETIRRWNIGYLPGGPKDWRNLAGLSVPCGIVIPCEVGGAIWYLKTRRASGSPKYTQPKGGRPALFGADVLAGHDTAVICEGEFDAMLLTQEAGDLAAVATLGGASNPLDLAIWGAVLLPIKRFWLAFDIDEAGAKGAAKLAELTARARRIALPVMPGVKDITDFHKAGGNLRDWLGAALRRLAVPSVTTIAPPAASVPIATTPGNAGTAQPAPASPSAGNAQPVTTIDGIVAPSAGNVFAGPTAAHAHAPQRVGVRIVWAADAHPATIGDYWQRLPDGRVLATYTPEELAQVLAIMGRPLSADTIRAECDLCELPPLGACK